MTFESIGVLFMGIALLAAKPGPGMMTVASKAMGEGLGSVLSFMVGTNLVKIIFFTLVVMGYGLLPEWALFLAIVLKAFAAAYLIWVGVEGLKKLDPDAAPNQAIVNKHGFKQNFWAGFVLTISNPFDILFFAGVLPAIFKVQHIGVADYLICAATIVLADAIVALSYAVPIALSRNFIPRHFVRRLNIVASVGLVIAGLVIGATALSAGDVATLVK